MTTETHDEDLILSLCSGGEGRLMREVVDTIVKRTEKFGGTGFQDWKFRIEMAVKGAVGGFMISWSGRRIRSCTLIRSRGVTEENSGYNSNLYYSLLRGRREKLSTSSRMWRARTAARHGESFVDDFPERPAENDYISFANAKIR